MRTLVLCYHSQNILGYSYGENDHVALASDLQAIARRRLPIISLNSLFSYLEGRAGFWPRRPARAIVLTCDDGTLLDWRDYQHPAFGFQPSFDRILREFLAGLPYRQRHKHIMTSFVIASPEAREQIDQNCYDGARLSTEDWWLEAAHSGRWLVGNHSWDHRHAGLAEAASADEALGHFYAVNNRESAEQQISQASRYLDQRVPAKAQARVFAYPYGHSNDYLANEYLPGQQAQHRIRGAVTTSPALVDRNTNRFLVPRFTCGQDWKSAAQFEELLDLLEL